MQTLARVMRCDASNVTGIVDRLEERGYIDRQVDPEDRRVRRLVVTDAGRAARKRLEARLTEGFPGCAALSAIERERLEAALTRLLEAMA
jgi:DNA-binding MarR family transcriptional regulator